MEREITHSCGHVERHFVGGTFASDAEAQARKLARMKCKPCFKASKKAKADIQADLDRTTLSGVDLPALTGSDRQVAWAATIRLERLAALHRTLPARTAAFAPVTDAKWWIDHRGLDLATLPATDLAA
ncbi:MULTISPECIES: hypothetical protein [unclassified Sphingomonas]|uniref:hypothetical protein n=1 Tax=unclassified Sphingomonas TaxID=196159 RepID=UPI002269D703|nr:MULTISPECIES: hypothetical protein [unclassified Sphingomonas]